MKKGQLSCHVCGQRDFDTEKEALEHIKQEHEQDFCDGNSDASDFDVALKGDESTDETEGLPYDFQQAEIMYQSFLIDAGLMNGFRSYCHL